MKTFCSLALSVTLPLLVAASPAEQLRDRALQGSIAFDITESLTTEVGPRLAGTPAEARARSWAVAKLRMLGFQNVRVETYDMPLWVRGEEKAEIVSPYPQPLVVTALGRSGATPPEGITADIAYFATLDDLRAAPVGSLSGKIAFVSHAMRRAQDESNYLAFADVRRSGPSIAAQKGALAILIRSIGTDYHRNAHTGLTLWADGVRPIPAAALSLPDSVTLERVFARGEAVRLRLVLTPKYVGTGVTGNVIAEIPGREAPDEIVLLGAHLDSWDLGTGALDDGAGVGIVVAAAKLIAGERAHPRRTIRIVLFGAEEIGLYGASGYARAHATDHHILAFESDLGTDRVWQLASDVGESARPRVADMARLLTPMGITLGGNDVRAGSDLNALRALGVPTLALRQDSTTYFDVHHTADDTLDKIDRAALDQNVAALAAIVWQVADGRERYAR